MKEKAKVSRPAPRRHDGYELCRNPWNGTCENAEIAVYIYYGGERLPICRECWIEIAKRNFEWGEETSPRIKRG